MQTLLISPDNMDYYNTRKWKWIAVMVQPHMVNPLSLCLQCTWTINMHFHFSTLQTPCREPRCEFPDKVLNHPSNLTVFTTKQSFPLLINLTLRTVDCICLLYCLMYLTYVSHTRTPIDVLKARVVRMEPTTPRMQKGDRHKAHL